MPFTHSTLHTFTKSDEFSASDAQIQTQMAWPETGETSTGGWPPTCAASSHLLAEKVSAHPPLSLSAGYVSEDREAGPAS